MQQTKDTVLKCLGNDFNTAQATNAVRKLISITNKEFQKPTRKFAIGDGSVIQIVTLVSNFVTNYFTSLGIKSLVRQVKLEYCKYHRLCLLQQTKIEDIPSRWGGDNFLNEAISFRKEIRNIALEIDASKVNYIGNCIFFAIL